MSIKISLSSFQDKILYLSRTMMVLTGVVLVSLGHAQYSPKNLRAKIAVGPSFPVAKFADRTMHNDTTTHPGGWGKTGFSIQLALQYALSKQFGLAIEADLQENHQDGGSLEGALKARSPYYKHYQVDTKAWKSSRILAGGFWGIPIRSNKTSIEVTLLAGLLKTNVPGYSYAAYNDSIRLGDPLGDGGSFSGRSLKWAFCYQVCAAVNRNINSRFVVSAGLNFLHAAPSWSYTIYPSYPLTDLAEARKNIYTIESINLLIGAAFRL